MDEIVWNTLVYNKEVFDQFEISNDGKIRNTKTGRIYKTWFNHRGYEQVSVSLGNRKSKKIFKIHKAVAETFIPNKDNKPQVNHKDGNKQNNCISNLEWTTSSENMHHAYENGLSDPKRNGDIYGQLAKLPCAKLDINTGNVLEIFPSLKDAERAIGIKGHICKVCKGQRKSCGGFGWKYLDTESLSNNILQ